MQIKYKLTLRFVALFTLLIVISNISIFQVVSNFAYNQFTVRLKERAEIASKFFFESHTLNPSALANVRENYMRSLQEEVIQIFDENNVCIFISDTFPPVTILQENIARVRSKGEIIYEDGKRQGVGIYYEGKYAVMVSALNKNGFARLDFLKMVLLVGTLFSVLLATVVGYYFSREALKPISSIVGQVDNITATNLDSRVNEGNGSDEIAQLAIKFNKMLERLEEAFEVQHTFVSNASHELRTPLTSIMGQIEVHLMNPSMSEDSKVVFQSMLEDIKNLNKLTNGLLALAESQLDESEIKLANIRIDELLGQARAELIKSQKNYRIEISFSQMPEDENSLMVLGSEQLLKTALINLMDNACKYSQDNKVKVNVDVNGQFIFLQFFDNGIGISEHDLKHVFESFYRAHSARNANGHGIGLSLSKKIINLHKGHISITSVVNSGTTVYVTLPHKN